MDRVQQTGEAVAEGPAITPEKEPFHRPALSRTGLARPKV